MNRLLDFQILEAAKNGDVETVREQLNSGANVNSIRTADKKTGRVLFGSANSANSDDLTPLDLAYDNFDNDDDRHLQVASLLIRNGGETKRPKEIHLLRAIEKDQPDLVRFLLENGANANFLYRDNQMPLGTL
jgi:ankyrin repeat protein